MNTRSVRLILIFLAIFLADFCLLSFLPIIPVRRGAVVPPPYEHFSLVFASLQDIFGIFAFSLVGVRYQVQWYTLLAALIILAISAGSAGLVVFLLARRK